MSRLIAVCIYVAAMSVTHVAAAQNGTASDRDPAVRVEFAGPDQFTDVGNRHFGDRTRSGYLEQLRRHVIRRATPLVSEGQRLAITITELDMAGSFDPWRTKPGAVRIVTDVYPPRIDLRFALSAADGAVIASGERKLRDIDFLTTTLFYRGDPLRYEKTLLDNWLVSELGSRERR